MIFDGSNLGCIPIQFKTEISMLCCLFESLLSFRFGSSLYLTWFESWLNKIIKCGRDLFFRIALWL